MLTLAALVVSLYGHADGHHHQGLTGPLDSRESTGHTAGVCDDATDQQLEQRPVRSSNLRLTRLITRGVRQSTTFARLAAAIGERRAVVYVESLPSIKGGLAGAFVHDTFRGADGTKYFRVLVERGRSDRRLIAIIAHELHHVLEFLAQNTDAFAAAYAALRADVREPRSDLRIYETEAALAIGQTVSRELAACGRR